MDNYLMPDFGYRVQSRENAMGWVFHIKQNFGNQHVQQTNTNIIVLRLKTNCKHVGPH